MGSFPTLRVNQYANPRAVRYGASQLVYNAPAMDIRRYRLETALPRSLLPTQSEAQTEEAA